MSHHIRLPAGSYFVDPAAHLDRAPNDDALAITLTKLEVIRFYEWINRGRARQRALRSDLVSLCICPHLLPCKRASAAWCAREHGVTREWASRLRRDFMRQFSEYIHFSRRPETKRHPTAQSQMTDLKHNSQVTFH